MDPNSLFNPEQFLGGSVEGEMATRFEPLPAGVYTALIEDVAARQLLPNERNPKGSVILDVSWNIDNPDLAVKLNRQKLTVRQSIFLDLTETGQLDLGPNKNVTLGRLRNAVGQNKPGQPWSPMHLKGAGPCHIEVIHDPNKDDPSIVYERIRSVSAIS